MLPSHTRQTCQMTSAMLRLATRHAAQIWSQTGSTIPSAGVNRFESLCYIDIPDLMGAAIFFRAVKCGYKVFFPSARNPPTTNSSLINNTDCSKVIFVAETAPLVREIDRVRPGLRNLIVPTFQGLLRGDVTPSHFEKQPDTFSYEQRSFEESKNDPIALLHSSGSTGFPKLITGTHGAFTVLDNDRNLPVPAGRKKRDFGVWDFPGGGRFYHPFPISHSGFFSNVGIPTFANAAPVLGPPTMPPSGSLIKEIMSHQTLRVMWIPPAVAEQLLHELNGINFFKGLDFLAYTGAPFSPTAGKALVEVTELCPLYGSTEASNVPQLVPSKEDWTYMEWNPAFKFEMQASEDEEGAYEMVLFADASTEKLSALNHTMPGTTVWKTKDLFMPHPTKPNLWRYFGRRDDILLSIGAKFNPVSTELMVQDHPLLAGALVIGTGRIRPSLLVEPKPNLTEEEKASIVSTIWPRVEEANALLPEYARVDREKILVADTPFVRAGKGMIVGKLTEMEFAAEIEGLYAGDHAVKQI